MIEWHLDPVYIVNHWSDELLSLMSEKLVKRKERELDAIKNRNRGNDTIPDTELFNMMGNKLDVVKE